ncbi:hypothetical protein HanIR_Chr12g0583301 [Helianthus annuus]|nr:hypothetical protein HanIR_Chr12g0583301 [Helianthus annuus]
MDCNSTNLNATEVRLWIFCYIFLNDALVSWIIKLLHLKPI